LGKYTIILLKVAHGTKALWRRITIAQRAHLSLTKPTSSWPCSQDPPLGPILTTTTQSCRKNQEQPKHRIAVVSPELRTEPHPQIQVWSAAAVPPCPVRPATSPRLETAASKALHPEHKSSLFKADDVQLCPLSVCGLKSSVRYCGLARVNDGNTSLISKEVFHAEVKYAQRFARSD
jgi:hypothetical protein